MPVVHARTGSDEYSSVLLAKSPNFIIPPNRSCAPFFFNGFHMTGRDSNSHFLVQVTDTWSNACPDNQCDLTPITYFFTFYFIPSTVHVVMDTYNINVCCCIYSCIYYNILVFTYIYIYCNEQR